jgi:hypothetical protein
MGDGASRGAQLARGLEQGGVGASPEDKAKRARGLDLTGGDITTTKFERTILFVGLLVATIICSLVFRACAGGSDSSWVQEHRAHINPDD